MFHLEPYFWEVTRVTLLNMTYFVPFAGVNFLKAIHMIVKSTSLSTKWRELASTLGVPDVEVAILEFSSRQMPMSEEEKCFHVVMHWRKNNDNASVALLQDSLRQMKMALIAGRIVQCILL